MASQLSLRRLIEPAKLLINEPCSKEIVKLLKLNRRRNRGVLGILTGYYQLKNKKNLTNRIQDVDSTKRLKKQQNIFC